MSVTGIATAEHPENVAALDNQLIASPSEVHQEDAWPLEGTGAQKLCDDTEKSGRVKAGDVGDDMGLLKLKNVQDASGTSSGKIVRDANNL